MELLLVRKRFTNESTIGDLFVDGAFTCYILEDKDRGLYQEMPLQKIQSEKVYGKTAIPTGRYEVVLSYSNRFKKYLPLIMSVPGFEGIRIHAGNSEADSLGCLLTGTSYTDNMVAESRKAFAELYAKLKSVEKKEKIFITIKSEKAL